MGTNLYIVLGNYGDRRNILLTNMGYREERTGVSSHGNTTGFDHDHLLLRNSLGRDHNFGKVIIITLIPMLTPFLFSFPMSPITFSKKIV